MLTEYDLRSEIWREYDFGGRVYHIKKPIRLYISEGGTTHRVVDSCGTVHCCPAPGHMGCVLRWCPKDINNPVQF